ncbi:unnamed protein product [Protopolystoma xenopodis]|uniref:Uncharacterized protein n=1 Tax=Protopolystoma xenopodis TaxID=117903 RepID=A0A3S5CHH3_9PLAT|nr:unnamed protein product [Protopolystoma xenopodis]
MRVSLPKTSSPAPAHLVCATPTGSPVATGCRALKWLPLKQPFLPLYHSHPHPHFHLICRHAPTVATETRTRRASRRLMSLVTRPSVPAPHPHPPSSVTRHTLPNSKLTTALSTPQPINPSSPFLFSPLHFVYFSLTHNTSKPTSGHHDAHHFWHHTETGFVCGLP